MKSEDIEKNKNTLRKEMLKHRAAIDSNIKNSYDQWVCNQLYNTIEEWEYEIIHCYIPMNNEIDILPLIEKLLNDGKVIIAPKTLAERKLQHLVLTSTKHLEKGIYDTQHPANSIEYVGNLDLIIAPGLAYDYKGNRLGYGGGYYDTFFAEHSNAHKIGLAYPFQRMKNIPLDRHDVPVNEVISKREM